MFRGTERVRESMRLPLKWRRMTCSPRTSATSRTNHAEFKPALLVEGERELVVIGKVPLVKQSSHSERLSSLPVPPPASSG